VGEGEDFAHGLAGGEGHKLIKRKMLSRPCWKTRASTYSSFFPPTQHDPENNKVCVPGGEDGNYIMFARATSGDKSNNRKFSPCSLKSVKEVLNVKARGPKGCFIGEWRKQRSGGKKPLHRA